MEIVGFVGFAGVVVFGLLYIVFFFKGASLKIPVIGIAAFALVLAAAVLLTFMGITAPWSPAADEPSESVPAGGGPSEPAPASAVISEEPALISDEPALTSAPVPESASTSAPESTSTPAPTSAPTPTPVPTEEFKRTLTGVWSTARRSDGMIYTESFDFSAGGILEIQTGAYGNIHIDYIPDMEADEHGWYWAPMGQPGFYGNYSLTASGDDRFAMKAVGEWSDAGPVTSVYELTYVNDNTLLVNGMTYVRGGGYTLAELARIFGFNIEA